MKAPFLPPLIALAAGLAWIGYQHHRLETLTQETGVMQQAIEAAQRADRAADEAVPVREPKGIQAIFQGKKIAWDKLLELAKSQVGDVENIRLQVAMKKQLAGMTVEEIEAEFDRIATMDFSEADRKQIEQTLAEELAERDPRWVVEHLFNRLNVDSWNISRSYQKWVQQDPAAVLQWIDRQVATGGFDTKSLDGGTKAWVQYESGVIPTLMRTDPAAALARLKALPDDGRVAAFSNMLPQMRPGEGKAYIEAMRSTLAAENYNGVLDAASRWILRQGQDQMDNLLLTTNPSKEEREVMVNAAFQERRAGGGTVVLDTATIDRVRTWGAAQTPDQVERMTGSALGNAHGDFDVRAKLALQYAEGGGGDDLLASFLDSSGMAANAETAATLLEHISDENRREDLRVLLQARSNEKPH